MLIIPIDGPPIEHRVVTVLTTTGLLRGEVLSDSADGLNLRVGHRDHLLPWSTIRTIVSS